MEEYMHIACALGAVLLVIILMYFSFMFVMRERTFESAIAEQSRMRPELLDDASPKHDRKPRRQQVRSKRTEKSSPSHVEQPPSHAVSSATVEAPQHSPSPKKRVELELEPEIIDGDGASQSRRHSSPTKPSKPILMNKGEKSDIADTITVAETFHARQISVDELEMKVEFHKLETAALPAAVEATGKPKKKKAKVPNSSPKASDHISGDELTKSSVTDQAVKSGIELVDTSPQQLTSTRDHTNVAVDDKHLRQISDLQLAVSKLRQQLDDKEKVIYKGRSQVSELNDDMGRLRNEFVAEVQKNADLQQQNKRVVAELAEMKKVNAQCADKHAAEMSNLRTQIDTLHSQLADFSRANQQLTDDNKLLKESTHHHFDVANELKSLKDALQKSSATMASTENAKRHLEAKVRQYEDQMENMAEHVKLADSKTMELTDRLHAAEVQIANVHKLENCLKEAELQKLMLESHVSDLQCRLLRSEDLLSRSCQMTPFSANCVNGGFSDTLETASKTEVLNSMNSSTSNSDSHETEVNIALRADLAQKAEEIVKLESLLLLQKKKNEELRQKNSVTMDALNKMEKMAASSVELRDDVISKEAELRSLRAELKELKNNLKSVPKLSANENKENSTRVCHTATKNVVRSGFTDLSSYNARHDEFMDSGSDTLQQELLHKTDEVIRLEQLLNAQKWKNEDLRQKNCAVLEAFNAMENLAKSAVSLKDEIVQREEELKKLRTEMDDLRNKAQQNPTQQRQVEELEHLRTCISQKDVRLSELEKELATLKSNSSVPDDDVTASQGADIGRREVTFITRIQETSCWDLSQLVLELDTKNAELRILQSLLGQNENALHNLLQEKADINQLVKKLQSELAEKNAAIKSLYKQQGDRHSVTAAEVVELKEQLGRKETELQKLSNEIVNLKSQLQERSSANDDSCKKDELVTLQATVQHYKKLLHDTETMLSSLEASVEKEELMWKSKIASTESDLVKAKEETNSLKEQLLLLQNQHVS